MHKAFKLDDLISLHCEERVNNLTLLDMKRESPSRKYDVETIRFRDETTGKVYEHKVYIYTSVSYSWEGDPEIVTCYEAEDAG